MYNPITTEDFDKWITAESRTFEVKCDVVDGADTVVMSGTGQSGDIISMEWNNVICSNDGLQIGTCCMDEFRMTYRNKDSLPSLMDKEIHPYVGLVCPHENTGDVTVWIPLGVFYVTNTETEDEEKTFTLTAYDGMQKLLGDFNASVLGVTFPINAWALLTAITTHFGLTISYDKLTYELLTSDNFTLTSANGDVLVVQQDINANQQAPFNKPLEGTYRDYVGWIAGLVGANAHMGRNGDLRVSRYENNGYEIKRDVQHMGGAKINYGGTVTYECIISGTDESPLYPTNRSGNAITYTNPYITQDELDILNDAIFADGDWVVTPCDVGWRSDPRIDAGDIVFVEDKNGNLSPTFVMERVVRVTGGLAEELHCYAETELVHTLNKSPLVTKLAQLTNDIKEAVNPIEATKGTFEFINNGDGTNGGFTIYENDSNSWLRCTAGGLGISDDGGLTYTNAITKNGIVASQIDVNKNGAGILKVYSDPRYSEAHIRMGNGNTLTTASGNEGFLVTVNSAGSFMRFRNPRTLKTSLHFISAYTDGGSIGYYSYSNLYIVDPITDNHVISLDSVHYDSGLIYNATVRVLNVNDASMPAVMMTSRSNNGVLTNDAGVCAVGNGNVYAVGALATPTKHEFKINTLNNQTAFLVTTSEDTGTQLAYDGHYLTWKTITVGGTTYHVLGY